MTADALLPADLDDFRSVHFWDNFFKKRGNKPFEWYGEWRQLRPLVRNLCIGKKVLMVGCGNSSLSADMYDDGIENITNIDFSKVVIKAMMTKNLRQRPNMKWQVMDMTSMKFPDDAFQVVVDKGGLDALMAEDTPLAEDAGKGLLGEVVRVLDRDGGVYLCVTLAQPHVLRKLLKQFARGWHISLSTIPPTPNMAQSPLQPLLAVLQRADLNAAASAPPVELTFPPPLGWCPNKEQLTDIRMVVESANVERAAGGADLPEDGAFDELAPGRRVTVELHGNARVGGGQHYAQPHLHASPRFTADVLDVDGDLLESSVNDCAIFIVPQGREHEWAFSTEEGQRGVVASFPARRVVFVRLNPGHTFTSAKAVAKEVNQEVQRLLPACVRGVPGAVPIATLGDSLGWRAVRLRVASPLTGDIVVEDVWVDGEETGVRRRMMFASSRHLVQTEARICPPHAPAALPRNSGQATSVARATTPKGGILDTADWVVEEGGPISGYHLAMILGSLALGAPLLEECRVNGRPPAALVVGVGGGALPMQLHSRIGMAVQAIELDGVVLDLARRFFGFADKAEAPSLEAVVGNGLEVVASVAESAPASLDFVYVDANSGDASQPLSCPPAAFLEAKFLKAAKRVLAFNGLLAVNCVSRQSRAIDAAVAALQAVFSAVYSIDLSDDVNCVLFATSHAERFRLDLDNPTTKTEAVNMMLARCPGAAAIADSTDLHQGQLNAHMMLSRLSLCVCGSFKRKEQ